MTDKNKAERPLSPHLQVYRWELTMALSILQRITGVALLLGLLLLVCWLLAVAGGPERLDALNIFLTSPFGITALLVWTFAVFLHLGNGLRHLFWDIGLGFSINTARRSGWAVILFTVVATAVTWWCALGGGA